MTTLIQSTVTLPNGRHWLTLDNRLVTPVSFLGKGSRAKVRKGVVEFLAMTHQFGGAIACTGSMRHVGVRVADLGLVSLIAAETTNGRKVVHYRLTEGALVADLAERCAHLAREKGSVSLGTDGETARADVRTGAAFQDVPLEIPRRHWPEGARACPACRCTPDAPCTVVLDDRCGEASCAPAGLYDLPTCSACSEAA